MLSHSQVGKLKTLLVGVVISEWNIGMNFALLSMLHMI